MNKLNTKREIFVFVGQNASTGTPNPNTGLMNFYGTVYRIDGTLKQAREWADDMYYKNTNQTISVAGGKRKMREFCLGQTMRNFEDYLSYCPTVCADDEKSARDWHIK